MDDGNGQVRFRDARLAAVWEKVRAGERLDLADGQACLETGDVLALGRMADHVKHKKSGEWVYFVTSREASLPLRDSFCAVDAAIVGKVDCVDLADGVSTFGCEPAPAAAAADATGTP